MSVHPRMPVVAAVERRREHVRRQNIGVTQHDVGDLVGILLVQAGQGEMREPRRCRLVQGVRDWRQRVCGLRRQLRPAQYRNYAKHANLNPSSHDNHP